ncbi:hypothetical protein MNEG_16498, partial [Monoraphidium neglectum]
AAKGAGGGRAAAAVQRPAARRRADVAAVCAAARAVPRRVGAAAAARVLLRGLQRGGGGRLRWWIRRRRRRRRRGFRPRLHPRPRRGQQQRCLRGGGFRAGAPDTVCRIRALAAAADRVWRRACRGGAGARAKRQGAAQVAAEGAGRQRLRRWQRRRRRGLAAPRALQRVREQPWLLCALRAGHALDGIAW